MSAEKLSLAELNSCHYETRGVEIMSSINLPEYAPVEDIFIDVNRIATLAKYGRLASINFMTYDGNHSANDNISIGSAYNDGTASASKTIAAVVSRATNDLNPTHERYERYPRSRATIRLNTSHPDIQTAKIRTPQPWATLLDEGIREGVIQASTKQLLRPSEERRFLFGFNIASKVGIAAAFSAVSTEFDPSDLPTILPIYLAGSAVLGTLGLNRAISKVMPNTRNMSHPETSLFENLPIDRLMIVKALAQRTLVSS